MPMSFPEEFTFLFLFPFFFSLKQLASLIAKSYFKLFADKQQWTPLGRNPNSRVPPWPWLSSTRSFVRQGKAGSPSQSCRPTTGFSLTCLRLRGSSRTRGANFTVIRLDSDSAAVTLLLIVALKDRRYGSSRAYATQHILAIDCDLCF